MKKKSVIVCLTLALMVYLIGILLSNHLGYTGFDYFIYYNSVARFWSGLNPYIRQFYYLNYFYILSLWMYLFPYYFGFGFFILITMIMYFLILWNLKSKYEEYWFFGNVLIITIAFITFNVDIWCVFSLIMYQKYSEKWFSPLFFLLSFFKATMIVPAFSLFLINSYFKRKIPWNQVPAILILLGIFIVSLITSGGVWLNILSSKNSNLLLQVSHWMWLSYPVAILLKYKAISLRNLRIIWFSYFLLEASFGIVTTMINNYIPNFIQSL